MNAICRTKRAFLFSFIIVLAAYSPQAHAESFGSWLHALRRAAIREGISPALAVKALPYTMQPDDRVVKLDHAQPEGGTITFQQYKDRIVTPYRLREGRDKMRQYRHLLGKIGHVYGVPPQYIVALWGMESSYGRFSGDFNTIRALATLSYQTQRRVFFRRELIDALHIIQRGDISLEDMKGSWAGAMGQCQFMPSSYEKYAQDYNKDGKRDIWHTKADVFASTAAYLSDNGWFKNEPWGVRIYLPKNFNTKLIGLELHKPLKFWRRMGIRIPAVFSPHEALSVVQPGGKGYKTYVVGKNYRILLNWNSSTYFATAVGLLADGLKS